MEKPLKHQRRLALALPTLVPLVLGKYLWPGFNGHTTKGRIQDFLIGGSIFFIVPDYLLFFPDFSENSP